MTVLLVKSNLRHATREPVQGVSRVVRLVLTITSTINTIDHRGWHDSSSLIEFGFRHVMLSLLTISIHRCLVFRQNMLLLQTNNEKLVISCRAAHDTKMQKKTFLRSNIESSILNQLWRGAGHQARRYRPNDAGHQTGNNRPATAYTASSVWPSMDDRAKFGRWQQRALIIVRVIHFCWWLRLRCFFFLHAYFYCSLKRWERDRLV